MEQPSRSPIDELSLDALRSLVKDLVVKLAEQDAGIKALKEEITRLNGHKGKPKLKPSDMEQAKEKRSRRRGGKKKGSKPSGQNLVVNEEQTLTITPPAGPRFKGYQDFPWLALAACTRLAAKVGPAQMRARLDRLFTRKTGFVTLDRLLARLHARKDELLRVLDRPAIPLHTNGSENDIRCQVTKRKISGGTWSDHGRRTRDTFLGLLKTCQKLGISFFEYLGDRLGVPGAPIIQPHRYSSALHRRHRHRLCPDDFYFG